MTGFEKLGIDEDFNPFYSENDIKVPNAVQTKVIPKILEKKSIICVAQTGTGKTLAYALPLSEIIKKIEDEDGPSQLKGKPMVIIVAPTKELAVQISNVFKSISHHVKLRVRSLVGGQRNKQTNTLKDQSFEILIGTPNKIVQVIKKGDISFHNLKALVFDEADTLFDMGFKKDIESIIYPVSYDHTDIHFFSATLPDSVETFLYEKFKKKTLEKVTFNESHKVQQKIETFNIYVSPHEKMQMVKMFLEKTAKGRGILFANQKNQVDEISKFLSEEMPNLKFKTLHGGLEQKERLAAHKAFVDGKSQVLVATDVAARGLDIKDLKWIFNFGLPKSAEFYLHRCGRTGRAGKTGTVYNLVTHYDSKLIGFINDAIKKSSNLDLDFITKDIKDVKKKAAPKPKAKQKLKRVKITKRTKR